jgi:hypothetical protein
MSICTPATLYAIVAALSIFRSIYVEMPLMTILFQIIFAVLWVVFMNFLCSKGYSVLSWIILFLPFLLMGIVIVGFTMGSKAKN